MKTRDVLTLFFWRKYIDIRKYSPVVCMWHCESGSYSHSLVSKNISYSADNLVWELSCKSMQWQVMPMSCIIQLRPHDVWLRKVWNTAYKRAANGRGKHVHKKTHCFEPMTNHNRMAGTITECVEPAHVTCGIQDTPNWYLDNLWPNNLPSVLSHCWLGVRKSIRPIKAEWWGAGVVIFWSEFLQMVCIWFSWCHCHPIISASAKSRMVYPSGTDSLG